MTVLDTDAIRFRLLRSYRLGTANDSQALDAACRDVAALCAEVDRLRAVEEQRRLHFNERLEQIRPRPYREDFDDA